MWRWRGTYADVSMSRYSRGTLSLGHSCGSLVGSSCGALFWDARYYKVANSHLPAPQLYSAYYSCTTKSPVLTSQLPRYARAWDSSPCCLHFAHSIRTISAEGSCLHFAPSTRTISAEGCGGQKPNRTLACISRPRHARSPQRVARDWDKSHSRLHFAHSTRTISPQRVARNRDKSHSRLHFVRSTCTISAEGCPRPGQIVSSVASAFEGSLQVPDMPRRFCSGNPSATRL